MKKVLLMIAVVAVLALSACGNRKAAKETDAKCAADTTCVQVCDSAKVDTVTVQ